MSTSLVRLPERRRRRLVNAWSMALVVAVVGAGGLARGLDSSFASVTTVEGVAELLDPGSSDNGVNVLLVGSDSRAGLDPEAPDAAAIGTPSEVTGRRSDTVMILRRDPTDGSLTLVSLPRDLWVEIPGWRTERINAAYAQGPEALVATVTQTLGIPLHHYLEVDLAGFQAVVAALGGVDLCVDTPVRDTRSGLAIATSGCHRLDAVAALAYVRSRAHETFQDGVWSRDPTADLGRTQRQRIFVDSLISRIREVAGSNPFAAAAVGSALLDALSVEEGFDLVGLLGELGRGLTGPIGSLSLPVRPETVDSKAVLRLASGADAVLDWLAGRGPRPS